MDLWYLMLHTDHIHSYIVVPACPGMATKHTGLPQNCGKMFPVPLRHDKFQNCFRWLRDYGPCGRFWAWDVGCISFLVGKDLFTAWKNAFKFRTGRKKLQVKLCFFLEGSPILEATTNPETTGDFPPRKPFARRIGHQSSIGWPFAEKSRPGI